MKLDSNLQFLPVYHASARGLFPIAEYKQTDALLTGVDLTLNDSLSSSIHVDSKFSLIRAYNTIAQEYLILTPPSRFEYGIKYMMKDFRKISDGYLRISNTFVARKSKVPLDQDIQAPPSGYSLLNLELGSTFLFGKQPLNLTLSINNILNSRYRDYLDRFRYYTDAVGRNVILRLNIPIKQ
jgi:iron complex outermembrane receptor protein